ncbi:phage tail protein [Flavobacterium yafengii]|uniref:phage tail protein n=1 Tax=Flavobacterium yafengii TaxID=3041253 RepID=UPI0024A8DF8A|nr:tail fiber protein [Flavobacterium yafengii]MDI6047058.1 tail fiber protein [Flavobacterium yafengii]
MSTEPFIGEIKIFGFNFAPMGHLTCSGQILAISTNTALFSLLGTTYGGNGQTTFGLPDLQGRVAKSQGQGSGLPSYQMGEMAGSTSITISQLNMPAHTHPAAGITANLPVASGQGSVSSPVGNYLAQAPIDMYATAATPNKNYGPLAVSGVTGSSGGSQPIDIQNPYLVVNYSIAINGIFPSRN